MLVAIWMVIRAAMHIASGGIHLLRGLAFRHPAPLRDTLRNSILWLNGLSGVMTAEREQRFADVANLFKMIPGSGRTVR